MEIARWAIEAMTTTSEETGDRHPEFVRRRAIGSCADAEPFALMVLGASMAPEFEEGDIIVIEPEAPAQDGSFVLAQCEGQWLFRQLRRLDARWWLCALNPRFENVALADRTLIRGVVIQKSRPGHRGATRHYVG